MMFCPLMRLLIMHPHQEQLLSSKLEAAKLHQLLNGSWQSTTTVCVLCAHIFLVAGNPIPRPRTSFRSWWDPDGHQMVARHLLAPDVQCVPRSNCDSLPTNPCRGLYVWGIYNRKMKLLAPSVRHYTEKQGWVLHICREKEDSSES